MTSTRTLSEFLRKAAGPVKWGHDDCCMQIANWWRHIHGIDPAAHLRGTYSTVEGKDAVLAANRNLQRLVTAVAAQAGAPRTRAPNTGDFGLIAVAGRPYGAICTGRVAGKSCWVARSETGLTFLTNPRILRAWSINVGQDFSPSTL